MPTFRGFCAVLYIGLFFNLCLPVQQGWSGYTTYKCKDGSFNSNCQNYGGYRCVNGAVVNKRDNCDSNNRGGPVLQIRSVCGDGVLDPEEVCDDGEYNSDLEPNACRSDCRRAYCGDYVVDAGEQCDEGTRNSDTLPNHCRTNCKLPVCGDGIFDNGALGDIVFQEECDDGNQINSDGCRNDCKTCLEVNNNLEVTTNTLLCRKIYNVADYGDEGALIVKYPGVTIDCDGATLQGSGVGAGILIKMSNDVTIRNCTIKGYAAGIKAVDSRNLTIPLGTNHLSANTQDIVLDNSTKTMVMEDAQVSNGLPSNITPKQLGAGGETGKDGGTMKANTAHRPSAAAGKPVATSKALPVASPSPIATATQKQVPATVKPPTTSVASGTLVTRGKQTFLRLNVTIAHADVYAGKRRLGRLPGGRQLDITPYLPKARRGELVFHYYDAKGQKTVQTVKVGPSHK